MRGKWGKPSVTDGGCVPEPGIKDVNIRDNAELQIRMIPIVVK